MEGFMYILLLLCPLGGLVAGGGGRMLDPPGRGSLWRAGIKSNQDYDDHRLNCGGVDRQHRQWSNKCGVCGDDYGLPMPRPHEIGGEFGEGIISRNYSQKQRIETRFQLVGVQRGSFYLELCNLDPFLDMDKLQENSMAVQDCLSVTKLQLIGQDDPYLFYPTPENSDGTDLRLTYQLPDNLSCTHCLLRWRYLTSRTWGKLENGTECLGCGPQEEYRACADISIAPVIDSQETSTPDLSITNNDKIFFKNSHQEDFNTIDRSNTKEVKSVHGYIISRPELAPIKLEDLNPEVTDIKDDIIVNIIAKDTTKNKNIEIIDHKSPELTVEDLIINDSESIVQPIKYFDDSTYSDATISSTEKVLEASTSPEDPSSIKMFFSPVVPLETIATESTTVAIKPSTILTTKSNIVETTTIKTTTYTKVDKIDNFFTKEDTPEKSSTENTFYHKNVANVELATETITENKPDDNNNFVTFLDSNDFYTKEDLGLDLFDVKSAPQNNYETYKQDDEINFKEDRYYGPTTIGLGMFLSIPFTFFFFFIGFILYVKKTSSVNNEKEKEDIYQTPRIVTHGGSAPALYATLPQKEDKHVSDDMVDYAVVPDVIPQNSKSIPQSPNLSHYSLNRLEDIKVENGEEDPKCYTPLFQRNLASNKSMRRSKIVSSKRWGSEDLDDAFFTLLATRLARKQSKPEITEL